MSGPSMTRRSILLDTMFHHAVTTVYTHVYTPVYSGPVGIDHAPVIVTDNCLGVSLHDFPVNSMTTPDTWELTTPWYRRIWVPRTAAWWAVIHASVQMKQMMDFPAQTHFDYQLIRAFGLWMGDALVATGYLPPDTVLKRGEVLSIAFAVKFR